MARDHLLDVCHKPTFVLLAYGYRRVSVVRGADISAARREGFKGHDFPRARQRAGTIRLVIPPEESTVIQRHYDALTKKSEQGGERARG
jgi:hypothetical protein